MADRSLKEALGGAGIPDEDWLDLLLFIGPTYIYPGPYPRSEKLRADKPGRKGRLGIGYLGGAGG